jgi:hypothetical protein
MHGQQCFDTVLVVDASPVPPEQIRPYALLPESTFQRGCFPPCLCPIWVEEPIAGTFALVELRRGPLFTDFAVVNVDWKVAGTSRPTEIPVRGFGTYRVGGEFAAQHQLSLDLWVDKEDQTRFDSGLVVGGAEFPRMDIAISVHGGYCFDTVIDLHARPLDDATKALWPGALVSWTSTAGQQSPATEFWWTRNVPDGTPTPREKGDNLSAAPLSGNVPCRYGTSSPLGTLTWEPSGTPH